MMWDDNMHARLWQQRQHENQLMRLENLRHALLLEAALLAYGVRGAAEVLRLCVMTQIPVSLLSQARIGKERLSSRQQVNLAKVLGFPVSYLQGETTFVGQILTKHELSLPPWMKLDLQQYQIRFDTTVMPQELRLLPKPERQLRLLEVWPTLTEALLEGLWLGRGIVPSLAMMQQLRRYAVATLQADPANTLQCMLPWDGLPVVQDLSMHEVNSDETVKTVRGVEPRVWAAVQTGQLPAHWQPWLEQVDAMARGGKLRLNKHGNLFGRDVVPQIALLLHQRRLGLRQVAALLHQRYGLMLELSMGTIANSLILNPRTRSAAVRLELVLAIVDWLGVSLHDILKPEVA